MTPSSEFVFGIESECLTAVLRKPAAVQDALGRFFSALAHHVPTLPLARHQGVFIPYGKVYVDGGHLELAEIECDSPYTAPLISERMQHVVARAVANLSAEGIELVLANNNHDGLLQDDSAMWGTHENYLTARHPSTFTEQILPFLVTRIYGGSGGVHHPSGHFLASVRSTCMAAASGGGTITGRAIHSLAREEHHMGCQPRGYRYHLILGDGHRSQFNLTLQLGATALAVNAATYDEQLRSQLTTLRGEFSTDWVAALRKVNILSRRGQPLQIHPLVIRTQRLYLEAARRVTAAMEAPPPWTARLLTDWERTLLALERLDRAWLARHLDTFAKYDFHSGRLAEQGYDWADLQRHPSLFLEVARLDQRYHEFCDPDSVFTQLDSHGRLDHRVGPRLEPGQEPEPYVPEVNTRARPRARFICEHRGCSDFVVDWARIEDTSGRRYRDLTDIFAQGLGDWLPSPPADGSREQVVLDPAIVTARVREDLVAVLGHPSITPAMLTHLIEHAQHIASPGELGARLLLDFVCCELRKRCALEKRSQLKNRLETRFSQLAPSSRGAQRLCASDDMLHAHVDEFVKALVAYSGEAPRGGTEDATAERLRAALRAFCPGELANEISHDLKLLYEADATVGQCDHAQLARARKTLADVFARGSRLPRFFFAVMRGLRARQMARCEKQVA